MTKVLAVMMTTNFAHILRKLDIVRGAKRKIGWMSTASSLVVYARRMMVLIMSFRARGIGMYKGLVVNEGGNDNCSCYLLP